MCNKGQAEGLDCIEKWMSTLPKNVCLRVKERKPKTSTKVGQLADDYTQARKQNSGDQWRSNYRRQVD